ncbi:MAG: hypothetical protein II900_05145 [Prevotella sp.]|nr:hypothetical protein [Prevotella sp.]
MVKVTSSVGSIKGKAGNMSYFEINGVTIGRAYHTSIKNPKTKKQMEQRIKMNNILNTYKYIKRYLQQNFEGIIGNKNASSFFRSYNLMKTPVWLTKAQKESFKFVLAPYVVAQGRINSVGYEFKNGVFVSDINVGDLEINDETEESILSSIICDSNEGWTNNDTLQIILLKQKRIRTSDEEIELPKCNSYVVTLDKASRTKIGDIPVLESLSNMPRFSLCSVDGKIAVRVEDSEEYTYAFAVVHGRGQGRDKIVSSQQLCLSDKALYDSYCSKEAFDKAYKSYK